MADPRPLPDLGHTVESERRRYAADEEMTNICAEVPCTHLLGLPGRHPISTLFLSRQELSLLRWCCSDENIISVARNAMEDGLYDKVKTSIWDEELAKMENMVERTKEYAVLSDQESKGIKSLVTEITAKFPPNEYLYVSVGSSPTLITTVMTLAINNAIVVDLPISNVGMEVNEFCDDEWKPLLAFAGAAMDGKESTRNNILIIDVLQKGRGVAFARELLRRYCGTGKAIRICSLGSIDPGQLDTRLDFGNEEIFQAGIKDADAEAVCTEIVQCTYKNIKLLKKYEQHSVLRIVKGDFLAPRKDIAMTLRLLAVIKDDLDWVKPAENNICGTIVEQVMAEHDIARAIKGICKHESNMVAVGWMWGVMKYQHGMSVSQPDKSQQMRFYQLFRREFSQIMGWLSASTSLESQAKASATDGFKLCLKPPGD